MYVDLLKKYDNPQFLNLQWFGESCVWCFAHGIVIKTINPNWIYDFKVPQSNVHVASHKSHYPIFFYGEQEGLGIYDCIYENSMNRCGWRVDCKTRSMFHYPWINECD